MYTADTNKNNNDNSYNKDGRILDRHWAIRKMMATAPSVPLDDQFTMIDGRRVYLTPEGQRRANFRLASTQPLRSETEILSEAQRIMLSSSNNNNNNAEGKEDISIKNVSEKNIDMPFSVLLAARSFDKRITPNRTVSRVPPPITDNYTDDGALVQQILNDLRENVLSDGAEYSGDDLSALIRKRYPGATPEVVQAVIDAVFNDAETFTSKVIGNNYKEMKVLISARQPKQLQQQQQRNQ